MVFDKSLLEQARCQTAKRYNNLFGKNNWMNDRLYEPNKTIYGENAQSVDYFPAAGLTITRNASNWLKSNLGIESYDYQPMPNTKREYNRYESAKKAYSEVSQYSRKLRAQSAVTRSNLSSVKALSGQSQASTFLSRVPELAPFELMNIANEINLKKGAVLNYMKGGKCNKTLRDRLSTTQIQKLLTCVGFHLTVNYLKAMLKELGFEWNGKSCSMLQLFQMVKEYINPQKAVYINTEFSETRSKIGPQVRKLNPPEQETLIDIKKREGEYSLIEILKDLFYSSGLSMYQIFKQATPTNSMNIY